MDLNLLLSDKGIDSSKLRVRVVRHRPHEPELKKVLPWLAAEKPSIFNMYQQLQLPLEEKQLVKADYLVSFIGLKPAEALFVGFYKVKGNREVTYSECSNFPDNVELQKLGMRWHSRRNRLLFNLVLTNLYQEWKGKLIITWKGERSWARWLKTGAFPVKTILDESALEKGMPPWNELILSWEELKHLPKSWIGTLEQWRGIYLITDEKDGARYIGSAYRIRRQESIWSMDQLCRDRGCG